MQLASAGREKAKVRTNKESRSFATVTFMLIPPKVVDRLPSP